MSLLVLFSLFADLVLARRLCRRLRSSLLATSFGGSGLWLAASVIVSREVAEFLLGLGPQELELLAVVSVSWCIDENSAMYVPSSFAGAAIVEKLSHLLPSWWCARVNHDQEQLGASSVSPGDWCHGGEACD